MREIQEEIWLRKRGVAETKAAQAAVAHARLNYRGAAALYEAGSLVESFDPERRRALLFAQALELYAQGDEFGDNAALFEAIAHYRQCLALTPRERVPLDWAMTQNDLGTAITRLGEREGGIEKLEDAVFAYREALKEYTRERVPLDWAATQNNLGVALRRLGKRGSGTGRLEEAVFVYREALKERTRERVPLQWAVTQNNLGNALRVLGERGSGTVQLEEAVLAYREALKERTRELWPLDWAMSTGNQGIAMMLLADRKNDLVMAGAALRQIEAAFEVTRAWGHARNAANYEARLPEARAVLDRLKGH